MRRALLMMLPAVVLFWSTGASGQSPGEMVKKALDTLRRIRAGLPGKYQNVLESIRSRLATLKLSAIRSLRLRDKMWAACAEAKQADPKERLAAIVQEWVKYGYHQGGAVYVRNGTWDCSGVPDVQVDFLLNVLSDPRFDLDSRTILSPSCKSRLSFWRGFKQIKSLSGMLQELIDRMAADARSYRQRKGDENKKTAASLEMARKLLSNLKMANDEVLKQLKKRQPPDPKGGSLCFLQMTVAYKVQVNDRVGSLGMFCGDCELTLQSLYECFDKRSPAWKVVMSHTARPKGKDGCRARGENVDESLYVWKLGASDARERLDNALGELEFGDVLSYIATGAEHTFMYTGGQGLTFQILEMGGRGSSTALKQNLEIAGLPVSLAHGFATSESAKAYLEDVISKPGFRCLWARRPLRAAK